MLGRLIDGRYQINSKIARGGMATVYLATDLRLERRVAVKVMHGHLADDSAFKSRFIQEARSAARLAHPNVVAVYDQGQDTDMAYLVMEYLPGITLRDLLKDYGKLTPEQTLDILDSVLRGLAAAHAAGIIHRDLKPENVLLADDGRIKIGDFGLARASTANTASGQALLGTIAYLSPELLTRGTADARSDIYAVGIMMFEMLTGKQPFVGEQPMQVAYQHANERVPAPSTQNPVVPTELDSIVLWATQRNPEDRPKDARDLLDNLLEVERVIRDDNGTRDLSTQATMVMPAEAIGNDDETRVINGGATSVAVDPVSRLSRATMSRRTRGFWLMGIVVALIALAGGLGWYFGAGPGAMVAVPATAGQTVEQAQAALTKAGFTTATKQVNSIDVPAGLVSGTDPGQGTLAQRGSKVMVLISLGPKMLTVPTLVGQSEAKATDLIKQNGFTLGTTKQLFSADVAAGIVIAAFGSDGKPLPAEYPEGGEVVLQVSAGAVPDVHGKTKDEAFAALIAVGLKPAEASQDFSDDVAAGSAISLVVPEGGIAPGDSVGVVISKGPDLVEVPNVVGLTIKAAMDKLEALGFNVTTNVSVVDYWTQLTVKSQSVVGPAKRGSTVQVNNP